MKTQSSYLNLFLSILILTMFGCNQTNKENVNLLLKPWDGPFEGVPAFDKVKVEDVEEAMLTAMELHLEEIQTISNNTASPSFENTIEAMELSGNDLQKAPSTLILLLSTITIPIISLPQNSKPNV